MPGLRGTGFHLHGNHFGGSNVPNRTIAVDTTMGGTISTEGNSAWDYFTVNAGITLTNHGCPFKVNSTLLFKNGSRLNADGNNASGATKGQGNGSSTMAGGLAGGQGAGLAVAPGVTGVAGSDVGVFNIGGAGGNGGLAGAQAGGPGGIEWFLNGFGAGAKDTAICDLTSMMNRLFVTNFLSTDSLAQNIPMIQGIGGGSGGGSGASNNGSSEGGGGGGGGGLIWIMADTIIFEPNVTITARGGNGGNGVGVAASSGGGGGGGGAIVLFYHDLIVPGSNPPQLFITGGAGGSPLAGGNAGTSGTVGRIVLFDMGNGNVSQFNTNQTL